MRYANVRQFDGGLVNIAAVGIGKEKMNQFRYGQNIRTRNGEVSPRPGKLDYCDFSAAVGIMGQNIGVLYEYNREYFDAGSTDIWHAIVFAVGNTLYYVVPSDSTTVAVTLSPALVSGDIYCVNCFDHLFIANGREVVKVFDGQSTLRQAGISQPTAPTEVSKTAGTRSRSYKYTYYRDADPYDIESPDSAVLTVDNMKHDPPNTVIGYTQAADAQVNRYRIYATDFWQTGAGTPETDFFLLAEKTLAQGVTDSHRYTDVTTDLSGAAAYDTTDRSIPPQIKYMLYHDSRIFGAGEEANPSILYYSNVGHPFYWDADNWDEVSRDDGDVITGLAAIGRTRYIFKNRSIWEWTGDPESITPITPVERPDASQNMVRVGVGCADPRSIVPWVNSLLYRTMDGHVYMLTVVDNIMLSEYVETDIKSLGSNSKAAILDDNYIISDGDKTMVCDLRRRKNGWEGFDVGIDPGGMLVEHNGYLLGSEGDKIIRYYTGTQDNGVDFTKIFRTAYPNLIYRQSAMSEAIFREVIARCRTLDSDFTVSVFDETETQRISGTYAQTDRLYSLSKGIRGDCMSANLQWTGNNVIREIALGYLLGRRH